VTDDHAGPAVSRRLMAVVAHPDDETLGAGGTLARATRSGHHTAVAVLAPTTTSRAPLSATATREDLDAAVRMLGVGDLILGSFDDNRLDAVPLLEIVRFVESAIAAIRPDVVLTHHRGDLNIDHRRCHEAVLVATRPTPGNSVETVLAFEVPSSTEWRHDPATVFAPNVFVDIAATIDTKIDTLRCYGTEVREAPHPRSPEAVRALAVLRGSAAGLIAAEGFELVRTIR